MREGGGAAERGALQAAAGFQPRVHSAGTGQELRGEVYRQPALLQVSRRERCPSIRPVHFGWAEAGGRWWLWVEGSEWAGLKQLTGRSANCSSSLQILFPRMNGLDVILSLSLCKSYKMATLDPELDCLPLKVWPCG